MSTLSTITSSETLNPISLGKINTNFSTLNTNKLEASDIAGKQNTLVSWTNIKTINSVTILGSGDLSIPTLTDWDKGDITLTSSATVWTIDNDVVTNAKLADMASATFKGRTTAGSGDPEDLTATQATALLNQATTGLKGLMSPADKTKLDAIPTWVGTFVWVKCTTSASQTIYDNSLDLLNFNTEEYDTDGFHSTSTNNGRITIPSWKGWKYQILWQYRSASSASASSNNWFALIIYKNWNSTQLAMQKSSQVISWLSEASLQVNWVLDLIAGDYIELYVAQRNVWSNTITTASGQFFSAYKIW